MKTITCAQFGGPCDFTMAAATEAEMKAMAWKHTAEVHPDKMAQAKDAMTGASKEQSDMAAAYFHTVWESVSEDAV